MYVPAAGLRGATTNSPPRFTHSLPSCVQGDRLGVDAVALAQSSMPKACALADDAGVFSARFMASAAVAPWPTATCTVATASWYCGAEPVTRYVPSGRLSS